MQCAVTLPQFDDGYATVGIRRLLTAAEVAERLRVPVSWVRKHGGEIPGMVRLGKYVRWNERELQRFIDDGGLS